MKMVSKFRDKETGSTSEVWMIDGNHFLVKYFDFRGIHMDASDLHVDRLVKAEYMAGNGCSFIERVEE